ncbi:hypothetical protein [Microbacterium jejuense]|uniref:hypothetical protein n=1 Tax=Microbacterium jejuense TaxID=1263637 RepID=UPI0031F11B9D
MTNLIWQFHIDANRGYDGPNRKAMAMASAELAALYAMKHGAEYQIATHSRWWANGYHGGPAIERFQLLDEKYDEYEYILYLDTDILISPDAPDIFAEYSGAVIAGNNQNHSQDRMRLEEGWLKGEFPDPQRYLKNYVNGAILMMSREFRQYLRGVLDVADMQVDRGRYWKTDGLTVRWPVYDQSFVSYWLASSPYALTPIDRSWIHGPHFYNHGGAKTEESMNSYFGRYTELREQWAQGLHA